MTVYIKTQDGKSLIEKGQILTIGGSRSNALLTGNDTNRLEVIGKYKDAEEAETVFEAILEKILKPTVQEVEKGQIFIDLKYLYDIMKREKIII